MTCKIDSSHIDQSFPSSLDNNQIQKYKDQLLALLEDFPYEKIHLEKDSEIADLVHLLNDELKLNLDTSLIKKQEVLDALINTPVSTQKSEFLNPAVHVLTYFDLVYKEQDKKKLEQFEQLKQINQDMDLMGKLLSLCQTSSTNESLDFTTNSDAKLLIQEIEKKFGLPKSNHQFVWENKQEVITYLNQKIKELTHKSSESMVHLQHQADQLKSMVDISKEILKSDADLKEYIIRKTQS